MADLGKKISELQETTDLAGLYTIGTDKNTQSKKVSLQFLKEAADYANSQGDYAKEVGDTVADNVGVNAYPTFSASTQYAAGSVVNYNGKLYRFTSLHPAGAWVGTDAVLTSIKAEADLKLTELESDVDILNQGGLKLKEDFIGRQVDKWLDEHPEATTTVQDHSLSIDKMIIGTLGYVTPEMFGAKGDGITDDGYAIKRAMTSGYKVVFDRNKTYRLETPAYVDEVQDVDIDFNGCKLIFAGGYIKVAPPYEELGTISLSANQTDIPSISGKNGILHIVSEEQWCVSSAGVPFPIGFSSRIEGNTLMSPFKYAITGNAVYYPSVRVTIKNVGDMIAANGYSGYGFGFWGCSVEVSHVNAKDYGTINAPLAFDVCDIFVHDCNLITRHNTNGKYQYGVQITASSDWRISRCNFRNSWASVTTSGTSGVSTNGLIEDCNMFSHEGYNMHQYGEHECTYGTKIINSNIDCVLICQGATILGSTIHGFIDVQPNVLDQYKGDFYIADTKIIGDGTERHIMSINDNTEAYGGIVTFDNCEFVNCNIHLWNNFNAKHAWFDQLVIRGCKFDENSVGACFVVSKIDGGTERYLSYFKKILLENSIIHQIPFGGYTNGCDELKIANCEIYKPINLLNSSSGGQAVVWNSHIFAETIGNKPITFFNCVLKTKLGVCVNCYNESYAPIS